MGFKYKVNHEYFEKIDSEYKAYILGLIYADGSIKQPKGDRQKVLHISLQEDDGYILDKFSIDAAGGSKYLLNPPSVACKGWKKKSTVCLTSDKICNKLISYGCNINKSRVGMKFPDLTMELIPHFIRGFLDGDGSIILKKVNYKYKRKTSFIRKDTHIQRYRLKLAFCSTDKKFLETILKYLNVSKFYISSRLRTQMTYILWIENTIDVKNSINYLYDNAKYFLKRKHDKILEFNKIIKSQAESTLSEGLETT